MGYREPQTPGLGGIDELTSNEELVVQGIASLADPNADRILFWDDSAGGYRYLTAGSGLTITDTTLTAAGSPGGSNTQLQFNDGGVLGGDADLTWNKTTNILTAGGYSIDGANGDVLATGFTISWKTANATGAAASEAIEFFTGNTEDGQPGSISFHPGAASGSGDPGYLIFYSNDHVQTGGAIFDTSLLTTTDRTYTFPDADGTFALKGLAGTKVYYVSDSSGGAVNRKLTFQDGILVSET